MSDTKYIEIVGLPGSGKTTISNMLVSNLEDSFKRTPLNINLFQKINIVIGVVILFFRFPFVFKILFAKTSVDYKNIKSTKEVVWNIKIRLLTEMVLIRKNFLKSKKIFFNDEGIIGRLVVLSLITNFKKELIINILDRVLGSNLTILFLDAPIDIAIERTFNRNSFLPFFHEMDSGSRDKFYKLNTDVYRKVYNDFQYNKMTIVNNGIKEDLERELELILEKIN